MQILYGIHPVEEALRAGKRRFDYVMVARERRDERLEAIVALCKDLKIRVRTEPRESLNDIARTPAHQGVVAFVRAQQFLTIEDVLEPTGSPRLMLALDGVEDPQNLGALLRSADGAGVDAVVMTERRAAPLSAVAAKAAAGAQEHLRIARVVNLVRSLEEMKRQNIWIIGLDERGTMDYDQFDFTGNCALVMGREGDGLHELVRRTCDHLLRIPMAGGVTSLNVSAAASVVLFEAYRQRRNKAGKGVKGGGSDKSSSGESKPKKQKGLGS
jgi:23S rRNA (guanosine2251-2'-O)-methyltransferase